MGGVGGNLALLAVATIVGAYAAVAAALLRSYKHTRSALLQDTTFVSNGNGVLYLPDIVSHLSVLALNLLTVKHEKPCEACRSEVVNWLVQHIEQPCALPFGSCLISDIQASQHTSGGMDADEVLCDRYSASKAWLLVAAWPVLALFSDRFRAEVMAALRRQGMTKVLLILIQLFVESIFLNFHSSACY